jgi:hypothetical protein
MSDPQLEVRADDQATAVAAAVLVVVLVIIVIAVARDRRDAAHHHNRHRATSPAGASGPPSTAGAPGPPSTSGEPACVGVARGAASEGLARAAADRAAPFDAEALLDMSPARAAAAVAAGGIGGGSSLSYNAGDAAAVTGRVYESGARLFGPGGLWNDPANRPRERPLAWSLGPLTGPLTASGAGVPAEFAVDSTPLPPDFACGYIDLPPATTGGASGVILRDKMHPNVPRWGSAPNAPPFAEAFTGGQRGGCRDAAGKAALGVAPQPLTTPAQCSDYWSWEQGGVALGTLAGGGAPVHLSVPDADERSGWSEGGSGSVAMQWRPESPSI